MKLSLFHNGSSRPERKPKIEAPQVGTKDFESYVFVLSSQIDHNLILTTSYNGHQFKRASQYDDYTMPAYTSPAFNLFLMTFTIRGWRKTPIIGFCRAQKSPNGDLNLEPPMTTGRGLNLIGKHDPNAANHLLQYFRTLQATGHGGFVRSVVKKIKSKQ